jgi:hypothetical protein
LGNPAAIFKIGMEENMTNELAIRNTVISNFGDVEKAANAMSKSGYFQDSTQQAQAIVKILAGQEMGFGPFASMNGIHIIKGKPGIGANLMAAAVKASGKYDYKIREMTEKNCKIEFFQGKESLGFSEFTIEDARKAGTQNLDKFPRNMLFARAMSNGVKWYTPDIFLGATVYTPEELGADTDEDGNVVETSFVEVKPEPAPAKQEPAHANTNGKLARPLSPNQLRDSLTAKADKYKGRTCSEKQRQLLAMLMGKVYEGDTVKRHQAQMYLTKHESVKDIPDNYVIALLDWLKPVEDSGGDYNPDDMAVTEATSVISAHLKEIGQVELFQDGAK